MREVERRVDGLHGLEPFGVVGVAVVFDHRIGAVADYLSDQLEVDALGGEQSHDMYARLTDDDVEDDIESRLLGAYEDLREWPYALELRA